MTWAEVTLSRYVTFSIECMEPRCLDPSSFISGLLLIHHQSSLWCQRGLDDTIAYRCSTPLFHERASVSSPHRFATARRRLLYRLRNGPETQAEKRDESHMNVLDSSSYCRRRTVSDGSTPHGIGVHNVCALKRPGSYEISLHFPEMDHGASFTRLLWM